jgi:hypothetical protein
MKIIIILFFVDLFFSYVQYGKLKITVAALIAAIATGLIVNNISKISSSNDVDYSVGEIETSIDFKEKR